MMNVTNILGTGLAAIFMGTMSLGAAGCGDSKTESNAGKQDNTEQVSHVSAAKKSLVIDGSSTVYPITEAVVEEYGRGHRDVKISVGFSGTGGGFKKFVKKEIDLSGASRAIKLKEVKAAKAAGVGFVELPIAYDGLSIVVSQKNTFIKQITVDQLKKIFLDNGKQAKLWSDVNPSWPSKKIGMFIPGTDSGTFDYFKSVVAGKKGAIRSDVTASEDDNVLVKGIQGSANSIGFFGYAYYIENKTVLRAIPVVNSQGEAITPSAQTIESGSYEPFSRPLFIYVRKGAIDKSQVKSFVDYYIKNAGAMAEAVGYVRLPQVVMDRVKANFEKRVTGTQFLDASGKKVKGPLTTVYQEK